MPTKGMKGGYSKGIDPPGVGGASKGMRQGGIGATGGDHTGNKNTVTPMEKSMGPRKAPSIDETGMAKSDGGSSFGKSTKKPSGNATRMAKLLGRDEQTSVNQ